MSSGSGRLAAILADEALAAALVPWACPCDFGPGRRYQLEELVGAGRESLIYRATDRKLSSEGFAAVVAVKIASAGGRINFEAVSARRISHPNVLSIIDHGVTPDGVSYAVAEYVDGGDLASRPGPWPSPEEAVGFIAKLARGVQAAHAAGVVHCDIKPANVLLTRDGEPKLGDFDLCSAPEDTGGPWRGNLAFMAPEQLRRDDTALTPPADIYALGGLLYWLLTGRGPNGDVPDTIIENLRGRTAPESPAVERDLDLICSRAMATRREHRHHSAGEFADDLDRWLRREPIPWTEPSVLRRANLWRRRRPARAVAVASLLLAAVSGASSLWYASVSARRADAKAWAAERSAHEQAVALKDEEMEVIKARVRSHIRTMYHAAFVGDTAGMQDRVLPTLVWLEWLVDSPAIDADARVSLAADRVEALRTLLMVMEGQKAPPRLDELLTRYTLAYFLLDQGEGTGAAEQLASVRQDWAQRLHPDDPTWAAIAAMESCAEAIVAAAGGEPIEGVRRILAEAVAKLGPEGHAPVRRLITRIGERLETPSTGGEP